MRMGQLSLFRLRQLDLRGEDVSFDKCLRQADLVLNSCRQGAPESSRMEAVG
jgi:hypothetical protein